jgi:hypothetical protein
MPPSRSRSPLTASAMPWSKATLAEDFFKRKADLSTRRTAIEGRVGNAVAAMRVTQSEKILAAEGELSLLPEWAELTAEEQAGALAQIQALSIDVTSDMAGLKRLVSRQFDIETTISEIKENVVKEGKARRQPRTYAFPPNEPPTGMTEKRRKTINLPARIGTVAELDALIHTLSDLRHELSSVDLDLVVKGD